MPESDEIEYILEKPVKIALWLMGATFFIAIIIAIIVSSANHAKIDKKYRENGLLSGTVIAKRIYKNKEIHNEITIKPDYGSYEIGEKNYRIPIGDDSIFKMVGLGNVFIRKGNEKVCSLVKRLDTIVFDPETGTIYSIKSFHH